ncbi:Tropinone reductase homolog At5g06060 [Linum grandiflorum]
MDSGEAEESRRWSLSGKSALVTGGTKGIGFAIVEELARLGASVHTCARNQTELEECLTGWKSKGFRVTGSSCDVTYRKDREDLVRTVSDEFDGKLDILVNNVGRNILKPAVEFTAEDFAFLMSTNLESGYHLCQLAHPLLKASGFGSVVFISSVAALVHMGAAGSVYSAAKGQIFPLLSSFLCRNSRVIIMQRSSAPTDEEFGMRVGERQHPNQHGRTGSHRDSPLRTYDAGSKDRRSFQITNAASPIRDAE